MPRRKDGVFAQVSCRILHGQRFNQLSEADQGFYLKLWILAVRERTACFPVAIYPTIYLSRELHVEHRRGKRALANLARLKLIEILPDGSVIIEDIMECHKNLGWEQVHLASLPCTEPGTSSVPKQEGEIRVLENRYKNPDSGAEIVTHSNSSCAAPDEATRTTPDGTPEDGQTARPDPDQKEDGDKCSPGDQEEDLEPWNKRATRLPKQHNPQAIRKDSQK